MNSKEALNSLYLQQKNSNNYDTKSTEWLRIVKQDLDRLEEFEKAFDKIIFSRPVMLPILPQKPNSINDYIREIEDYILALSSVENIVISAVYERYKKEKEKENDRRRGI